MKLSPLLLGAALLAFAPWLATSPAQASPASTCRSARAISFEIVPAPPTSASVLSPDGRWIALVGAPGGKPRRTQVSFLDLSTRRSWSFGLPARLSSGYGSEQDFEPSLSWSRGSRACAVRSAEGWRVVYPAARRSRFVLRSLEGAAESGPAWANRLAIFEDGGEPFHIWDGKRLSRGRNWIKSTDYPYPGDVRIWQAEWSPDESSILLRFYGHAERTSEAAGHTFVLSPRSGRALYKWGAETRPAAWIGSSRLAYLSDDDGLGGPGDLVVAQPRSHSRNAWLRDVVAWTISADRNVLWALKSNGDLLRTPSRLKSWQVVKRLGRRAVSSYVPALTASPRGGLLALSNPSGRGLTLISARAQPWAVAWAAPYGTVRVLGWAPERSLPLVELSLQDAPVRIAQLKW